MDDGFAREFRCPHGVVFARRSGEGAYSGSAAEAVCTRCGMSEYTMDERLRWHYEVAKLKGAPLTERDRQRLDDYEMLLTSPSRGGQVNERD